MKEEAGQRVENITGLKQVSRLDNRTVHLISLYRESKENKKIYFNEIQNKEK